MIFTKPPRVPQPFGFRIFILFFIYFSIKSVVKTIGSRKHRLSPFFALMDLSFSPNL